MSDPKIYRPGFFSSLTKSCYDSEFYRRINNISLVRTIGFLTILSLFISLISLITLSLFWAQMFPLKEDFLNNFDKVFPSLEGTYDGNTLKTDPSRFMLYFGFDSSGKVLLSKKKLSEGMIRFQVNSDKTLEQAIEDAPQLMGIYFYKNGLYMTVGLQTSSYKYTELGINKSISFTKDQLRLLIKSGFPNFNEWAKKTILITAPIMVFAYHFIGTWIFSFFFSILGIVFFMLTRKSMNYSFFIRLSIYSSVPALVITIFTALLSISVYFLPVIIYGAFYYYGLTVYKSDQIPLS